MKDLVPGEMLGAFFSKRSRYAQTLNVCLSIVLAISIDYLRRSERQYELYVYGAMFIIAGTAGLTAVTLLARVPEPKSYLPNENIFKLLIRPLKDNNFQRLLVFNSAWLFAVNIATPFFTVFMLKTLGLTLTYIIPLTILSQLSSIFTISYWGKFSDRYSNKTII